MELQRLLDKFRKITVQWKEKEVKGEGFNIIEFINRFWGIWETKHSQILGFLLNPRETHGQGGLFLKLFLEKLRIIEEKDKINPNDWKVEVEKRSNGRDQIDILIQSHRLGISIAIENKSNGAKDQSHQLYRYWESAIYNFHNRNKEKALDPKCSRVVYLPKDGTPSLQTRTRMKDYKEPYPEVLELEDKRLGVDEQKGKVISCWTYYEDIRDWLERCMNTIKGENHIIKHFIRNYIEFWDIIKLKEDFYMNELSTILKDLEDWKSVTQLADTVNGLKKQWANDFSDQLAAIECHSSFTYDKGCDETDYYNDFRWTYEGSWGDLAFVYEPHKGLSIWKAGAGKIRDKYKEKLLNIFKDEFDISQDSNSNYLMHLKNQNEIILCNIEDKEDIFLWKYHNQGRNVVSFIAEKLRKYTNDQRVQNLFGEINNEWREFDKKLEKITIGKEFLFLNKSYNKTYYFVWYLKGSNCGYDIEFVYYPNNFGFYIWKGDRYNCKEIYKEDFESIFGGDNGDFEWINNSDRGYIMKLKNNSFPFENGEFQKSDFFAYEVVEKLTEILQKYTNKPEVIELFRKINADPKK